MQKIFQINLAGSVFQIEEDAYNYVSRFLRNYSVKVKQNTADIAIVESNLATYFLTLKKGTIQLADALSGVDSMNIEMHPKEVEKKRLFRDAEHAMLGGVCGGIGAFFGLDRWIIRVLFLAFLFFGGFSILIYIILWLAVPKALTELEKRQMRSEKIELDGIETAFRNSVNEADLGQKFRRAVADTGTFAGTIITSTVIVILKVIGIFILLGTIPLLIAFVAIYFGSDSVLAFLVSDSTDLQVLKWALIVGSASVLLVAVLGALKLIYLKKPFEKMILFIVPIGWTLALALTAYMLIRYYPEFKDVYYVKTEVPMLVSGKKLAITMEEPSDIQQPINFQFLNNEYGILLTDSFLLVRSVSIDFQVSPDSSFHGFYVPTSFGLDAKKTYQQLNALPYSYSTNDNILTLQSFVKIPKTFKWRGQRVTFVVMVPIGAEVLMPDIDRFYVKLTENMKESESINVGNKVFLMTSKGLKCLDCD